MWCSEGDLNSHARRHKLLRLACLPVSPSEQWCRWRGSNSHGMNPHGSEPCLYASSSTSAKMTVEWRGTAMPRYLVRLRFSVATHRMAMLPFPATCDTAPFPVYHAAHQLLPEPDFTAVPPNRQKSLPVTPPFPASWLQQALRTDDLLEVTVTI